MTYKYKWKLRNFRRTYATCLTCSTLLFFTHAHAHSISGSCYSFLLLPYSSSRLKCKHRTKLKPCTFYFTRPATFLPYGVEYPLISFHYFHDDFGRFIIFVPLWAFYNFRHVSLQWLLNLCFCSKFCKYKIDVWVDACLSLKNVITKTQIVGMTCLTIVHAWELI